MSQPLGAAVGNTNEIIESVAVLRGEGPADVTELTLTFATEMLVLAGYGNRQDAEHAVKHAVSNGDALEVMMALTAKQGGDARYIEDPDLFERAPHEHVIEAPVSGTVHRCDALSIGQAGVRLGAGRATKDSVIDPAVGFTVEKKVGDAVEAGEPLARVAFRDEGALASALSVLQETWKIADEPCEAPELIMGVST